MTLVQTTAQARADLEDALDYRALYSEASALSLIEGFDEAVERLTRFPESGSPREQLGEGMRAVYLSATRLVLYYHVLQRDELTQVLVLRVLRQERDVDESDLRFGL